ncbi:MAG: hypothetical protein MJK15_08150 [Colwellia sp.]|nr:hypothetical protein [Colwellia sp.]
MWQFIALVLTLMGVTLLYLSNKHQKFIASPLTKVYRLLGYIMTFLALLSWMQLYVVSASICIWLFTSNVVLVCVPLLSLHKKFRNNKEIS